MSSISLSHQPLLVKIISPKEIIYNGQAASVSSVNSTGSFDVLPGHANFITILENAPIRIKRPGKEDLTYKFPLAIMYTRENLVDIYTDIQIND
jgi:F0F1-type ATP synthase epsilon subunit